MLVDQLHDPLVDLVPHFIGSHRPQFRGGNFHAQIERAFVSDVDDHRGRPPVPREKVRHGFDGLLRG